MHELNHGRHPRLTRLQPQHMNAILQLYTMLLLTVEFKPCSVCHVPFQRKHINALLQLYTMLLLTLEVHAMFRVPCSVCHK